ncbi:MAG: TonB-dependent receptor [Verrucomicrobiales bacterium]|nr:TonB-dependent receptor [Verrucomicrobiales bacterium]
MKKIVHQGTIWAFLALCLSAVGQTPASIQSDTLGRTNEFSLPNVLVTATQQESDPFNVPYIAEVRGASELDRRMPRTLPEALREMPSVMIQKTSHGQGSPFIRGFTGFRTLFLIDGIRLNNSTFREGPNQYWNTVDPYSIQRLEVVKGPSSVLYGSDAIGGTVNALTFGREEFATGFDWDATALYRGSTAESSHSGRTEVSANVGEQFGLAAGGTWKDFGDLRGGSDVDRQPETGYLEQDWDAKLTYVLDSDSRIVFGHQGVNIEDGWRTHSTAQGLLWEGTARGSDLRRSLDQYRRLTYLQYHLQNRPGLIEEAHFSLSYHLQEEQEFRVRNNRRSQLQGVSVDTLGTFVHLHSPSPVGRWIYGVEYYRDWVESSSTRYSATGAVEGIDIQGPVAGDASYDLAGAFIQDIIPIGDRVEVTIGGRFNYAAADAKDVQDPATGNRIALSDDWNAAVGSGRVLVKLDQQDHWHAFVGASQGFRAPNLSDLTRLDIAQSGELEVASPGLDPENFISLEAGLKVQYDQIAFQGAYFYTDIDDLIIRTPTGRTVEVQGNSFNEVIKKNSGDGFIHGVELAGSYRFLPEWTLRSGFTWMEGEVEVFPATTSSSALVTEPVSRLMPTTVDLGLLWEHSSRKFWGEAFGTITARQDNLSSADRRDNQRIPPGGTPGYAICGIRAGWRPCENFNLTLAVENLTDEDYRIHGSGLNEPGRNFIASAEFRF